MKATDFNRYVSNPVNLDISRSRFDMSHTHKTTFNAGDLIPIDCMEILPGDTISLDTAAVVRMSTPIHPVMDNAYMDVFWFFVPNRLVWTNWKYFMGESKAAFSNDGVEHTIPQLYAQFIRKGSVADHFGIPLINGYYSESITFNALPFRAYTLIWNEWFRDQNVFNEVEIDLGDARKQYIGIGNESTWFNGEHDLTAFGYHLGRPLPVAKFHDYFTSALPLPQKGPAVTLPVADTDYDLAVYAGREHVINDSTARFKVISTGEPISASLRLNDGLLTAVEDTPVGGVGVYPSNLWADVSSLAALSVNELRQAFAMQRLFEKDARGGTRYTEIIRSHFGVTSPDARQQRPEYLGGQRVPITISQVLQTSSTDNTSPQGNTAAYSLTQMKDSSFTYSATEHGYIIGLVCVRTDQTYQQGLNRMWSRMRRFDFYDPVFANLGEQAILNKELYHDFIEVNAEDKQRTIYNEGVFGYQEAWAEYRNIPDTVSGAFRSTYLRSLDVWHYGAVFDSMPTLSPEFISETRENIDRTLAVQSSVEDQFIADFRFKVTAVRPMPVYSVPGLIDHH